MVSHDERRPEHEIQFWGQHIQLADPADALRYPTRWDLALQKARLGQVALLTMPGVPMLLAGQEFGEDCERTIAFWPLDWGKLDLPQGKAQFQFCQRLLQLRREHPALRSDFVEFYWDDFPRFKVLRYKRWDGEKDVVVVGLNFDNVSQRVGLGFPQDGRWLEVLSGETVVVKGHWHDFVVPPWQAVVLVPAQVVGDEIAPDEPAAGHRPASMNAVVAWMSGAAAPFGRGLGRCRSIRSRAV